MLAVLGASLIGAAVLVLLALIGLSRTATWRWLARPGVAELITTGLVGSLAVGMVCIELHRRALCRWTRPIASRSACSWRRCSALP
jgi:hypothetical protein